MKANSFTQDDYEIIKRDVPYEGVFRIARYLLRFRLFNGNVSEPIWREVMERKSAVAVLPYDPVLDRVILIEQFRPGALANPSSPWLLEIVAGTFYPGEKPVDVARRETQEEIGCDILALHPLYHFFVSPGGCNEQLHLFCGHINSEGVEGIFGLADEQEDIHAFSVSFEEAFTLLQEGKINTVPAIIALQWLKLNREWLRELWQTK